MTRKSISALALLLGVHLSGGVAHAWLAQQPVPSQFGHGHIVRDSSGNVVMTGQYSQSVTKFRASDGSVVWDAQVSNYGRLATDSSNNVYTSNVGQWFDNQGRAWATLIVTKLSSSGSVLWTKSPAIGLVSEHASAGPIVIGSNGSVYAIGTAGNSSGPTAAATLVRFSTSNGTVQGTVGVGNLPDFGGDMWLTSLAIDASNNVYVATTLGLTRFSSTLGAPTTWSAHLPIRGITLSGSAVYVTGTTGSGTLWSMYVAKLTSGLSTTWQHTFAAQTRSGPYPSGADLGYPGNYTTYGGNGIAVDGAGNVYAAGDAVSPDGSFTGGTFVKFNSSGTLQWFQQIGDTGHDSACFRVAVGGTGNIVVTCTDRQLENGSSTAIAVVSNPSGTQLHWFSNDGPGGQDDEFDQLVIGASGQLFLLDESGFWNANNAEFFEPAIFTYTGTNL